VPKNHTPVLYAQWHCLRTRVRPLPQTFVWPVIREDGSYVYIANGDASGVAISRYNVALAAVDLNWNVSGSSSASLTGLVTVAGSPETVVVLSNAVVTIYDGTQPRWRNTAYPLLLYIDEPPVFATASRVYFDQPGVSESTSCWVWLDFDLTGVTSVQNVCAEQPDGMLQDGVLGYLTDGKRTLGVSLPGSGVQATGQVQVVAVDLAGGSAYTKGLYASVTQFNLSTGAQTTRAFQTNYDSFFVAQSGAVFVLSGYQIQLLP
jgi:hypothetical protein